MCMSVAQAAPLTGFYGVGPGWTSTTYKRPGNAAIGNYSDADDAINNGSVLGTGVYPNVNFADPGAPGGGGNFGGSVAPPGDPAGDTEDFAMRSVGFLQVTTAGNYQFRNNTDDGSRLRLDLNEDGIFQAGEQIITDNVQSGDHNADSPILALNPGLYLIEHMWFERAGGAEGDLGISINGGAFTLFGTPAVGGISVFQSIAQFPEPTTMAIWSMLGIVGLVFGCRYARRGQ